MQANNEGDISQRARRRAAETRSRHRHPYNRPQSHQAGTESSGRHRDRFVQPEEDNRLPPPRSEIERVYTGEKIVVLVLDNGFEYEGRSTKRSALWPRRSLASTATDTTFSSSTKKEVTNEQGQHQSPIELCDLHPQVHRRRSRQGVQLA